MSNNVIIWSDFLEEKDCHDLTVKQHFISIIETPSNEFFVYQLWYKGEFPGAGLGKATLCSSKAEAFMRAYTIKDHKISEGYTHVTAQPFGADLDVYVRFERCLNKQKKKKKTKKAGTKKNRTLSANRSLEDSEWAALFL